MKAKRLLALLLALIMALTLLPTAAWATEPSEEDTGTEITVTREPKELPEEPEAIERPSPLSVDEDTPIPGAERNVVVINDDFVADLSALPEDEDVCGEFEIVSEREPDEEPASPASPRRRGGTRSTYTFSGSGTQTDPWLISSEEDLAGLAAMVNAGNSFSDQYFKLTDDITITAGNWTPIGCAWDITFAGTFRGFEHTISGLTVTSEGDYVGLFGCVTGTINALYVSDAAISGNDYVGGIAGCNYGSIENCTFSGTVSGGDYVGGIAGCSGKDADVAYCDVNAEITSVGTGCGGVVGWANNIAGAGSHDESLNSPGADATGGGLVEECTFTGTLTGRSPYGLGVATSENGTITITVTANAFGGIVGWNNGCTVDHCNNYGTVNGDDFAGGIVGDSCNGGVVNGCENYGTVTGSSMLNGGIAGRIAEGSIYGCLNYGAVSGGDFTAGVVGAIDKYSSISSCFGTQESTVTSVNGKYVGGVVGIANCYVYSCGNYGSVTGAYGVGGVVGWTTRDIYTCGNEGSIYCTSSEGRVGGVVGCSYGLVENCDNAGSVDGVTNVEGDVKAPAVGGVGGHLYGPMKNCSNMGSVSGGISVGGVAGGAQSSGLISGCTNKGAVSGVSQVGGIIGMAYCHVTDCTNLENGTVTGSGERTGGVIGCLDDVGRAEHIRNEGTVNGSKYVGGLIGMALCEVSGLTNDGSVNGGEYTGGIAGFCNVVSNCVNHGAVKSTTNDKVGGIVGASNGSITSCTNNGAIEGKGSTGGIGGAVKGTITGCANSGSVTGTDEYTGGVLGYAGAGTEVSGCSNAAAVSGTQYVGGVVGYTYGEGGGISNCRNTAAVTGSAKNVGGVVGSTNAPVSNCENSAAVSGTEFVGGVAGLASDTAPIDHCTNTSSAVVTGTDDEVGGIVGVGTGAVDTCVNEGAIIGKNYVGGIAGLIASDNGVVRSCSNKGTVSGTDCVGGLVGRVGQTADGTDPSGLVEASKNTGSVSGAASVGGAVGVLHGTVRDCENNGAVTGGEPGIGGIVGYCKQGGTVTGCKNLKAITAGWQQTGGVVGVSEGTISDCVNEGAVEAGNNPYVGGIVGNNEDSGTVTGCTNKAKISGASNISGGVAGASDGTINGCSNTGEISNTGGKIGGIVGNNNGTVSNCANSGQVKGKTSGNTYAGGIVGYSSGNISGCTNSAQINAGEGVGGIAGFFYGSSIDGCTNNGTVTAPAGVAGGIVGAINNNSSVLNCSNNGNVNASGKNDVGGIIGLAQKNNTVTNCANTASVTGNNCVGGILGENGSSGTYSKLTNSGTISGNFETGGIAGDATAVFSDCLNTGNVTGTGNSTEHGTGGICGRLVGGSAKAERCKNTGSVSGTYFVGGIVGMDNDASLYNCLNEGAISSRNTSAGVAHVGGCVGYIENATVYKCVNYANVGSGTNINHVGGIAGTGAKMLFDFCRNYATITGRQEIGGIVGYTTHIDSSGTTIQRCINTGHVFASGADIGDVGGICGEADFHTTINECANNNPNAQVKADTGKYGGGIVGQLRNSTVSNCYNTGYVFAKGRQGGIVGEMKYTCTMATCFNKAGGDLIPVNGSTSPYRGALAGTYDKNATTLTYNYYSYYLGLPPMGNGTQAATASWNEHYDYYMWDNFGTQSNFKGFDFSNVYMMQSDRPRLRMEGGVATYSNTGPTTLADPVPEAIYIYTVEDLANLRDNVNSGTDYSGTTIFLEADLDMNGVNWTPIGSDSHYFNGFFEGQGHTVYNLTVNTGNLCVGLFGVNVGTIQDLEVHGSVTTTNTSTGYAGGIVGANAGGTVNCCAFYGDVRCTTTGAQTFTGGIAGLMNTGTISNCFHVGDVEGAAASGGLVSYLLAGTLENCFHYSGRISGSSYSGGIAAICGGTVKNCYVLSGTTGSLFASGTGTNCAFKSAAEFKDTTLGLGNFWLCGGEHPELLNFSWMATLRPNGGTGSAAAYGVPFFRGTLPPCPFYRDGGWTFIGWNTKADGTGTWYDDCGSFTTDETLYAQWLQGWKYYGYSSATTELFDNDIWSTYHCLAMERGETATVNFTTNDAVRPCAIAFYTSDTPSPIPPSWRLEAKVHASDGDWTVLGESDGASLSNTDKVVYVRLPNTGDDFYSAYRLVWQGPSDYVGLLEAWLLVSDPDNDVRKPLILHSNNEADQTNVVNANNGDTVSLGNPFTSDGNFFLGWNTAANGSGKSYANYEQITIDGVTDLYAQWLAGTHYRHYTALLVYDQFTELVNGLPANDSQYLGYSGEEYDKLLDDDVNTKWCGKVRSADAEWSLEFSTDEYVKPVGYVLVTADDTAGNSGRNPKNWTLEGLGKDGKWVMLDGILQDKTLPAANHAEICRKVYNDQEFCRFRITFRGLGNGTTFQLSELYLVTNGDARQPTVTFDSHGGTGTTPSVSGKTESTVRLPENGFTREGYDFVSWNTAKDGSGDPYDSGELFRLSGDTTLYAQWAQRRYTVKFLDENGETLYETRLYAGELPVYRGAGLSKEGNSTYTYVFNGWTPVIVPVEKDAEYTVVFKQVSNVYEDPAWTWGTDHASATATFNCITDPDRVEEVQTTNVTSQTTAATCEEDGKIEYFATVSFLGQNYEGKDTVVIPKLGHAYKFTRWEWTGTESAKAIFTCGNDANHVKEIEATITSAYTAPTCEGAGKTVYTAKVTFENKTYKDTKTVAIDPTGHAYSLTKWEWTDTTSAKAIFTCGNDANHVKEIAATITSAYTAPTCEGAGKTVYTAKVTFENKTYKDTVTVPIDPTGHAYTLTKWEWTGTESAKAIFTCGNDANHVKEIEATITSAYTAPTCEEAGKTVYTAKVTFENKTYNDTVTVPIDPTGHAYTLTKWEWTGTESAKAIFTCTNDASHVKQIKASITSERTEPTCEGAGKTVYTAKVTFENKTYNDTLTVMIEPTGHDYELTGWTWAINAEVNAIFTCKNDATHVRALVAAVTSETTPPTCEGEGKIVYTAKVTFEGKVYEDQKTVTIEPTGHAYALTGWTWEGFTAAKAKFTCGNDASHVRTAEATITSERTEPTCVNEGKIVYTAKVIFERVEYTDEKTELIKPTGHSYGAPSWKWSTDFKTAEASFTCTSGDDEQTIKATVAALTVEPTCTLPGKITYTAIVTFEEKNYEDSREVTIQPLGHSYGTPAWAWADDYSTAKATFTCAVDASHVQEVDATVTSVRTEPTCETAGKIVYSAKVTFEGRTYNDQKTVTIPATGHAYALTGWTWTGYTAAAATFTCGNNASHVESVPATITSERTEPTADNDGKVVYTAEVTFENKTYKDQKTEIIPALGRDYELTGWTWDGYTAATASFTDKNGSGDITLEAKITSVRTEPTCEKDGKIVYTATVTLGEKTYTDKKTEVLPATGHAYTLTGWTWTGFTAAKATFTCGNDATHVQEVEATITSVRTDPTADENGSVVYTAEVTFEEKTYQDQKTEVIPALGREYELTGWTWDGYTAATASFTDKNGSGDITVAATISSERTAPTCEKEGKIVYTATVTLSGKTYTDEQTEYLPATGHAYALTGWTWTGYTAAKATFTCLNDATHVKEIDAAITSVRTEPTADIDGSVVYTATAVFEGETYTDTKTVVIPALGREYELTGWIWDGYAAAAATFTDKNGSGAVTVEAAVTSVRTEPTCEEDGKIVYTAELTFEGKTYTDQKTETIPAIGHAYALTGWMWTGYTAAVATFTCGNDESHVETINAKITSVRTEPTADEDGSVVYTATVVFEEKTYTDTKTEIIPALGREYELTGWTWDGFTGAAATFTDKNGSADVTIEAEITRERTEPTCEKDGKIVYTATVTFDGKTYTEAKTEVLPAVGHDYALTGWTWTGCTAAKATFTCGNDKTHINEIEATITSERTEPTADKEGSVVYTATVTFEGETYTDTKTEVIPALGREYKLIGWTWEGETATATFADQNGSGEITVTATVTSKRTEPTCEEDGKIVYTASAEAGGKTFTDEKTEDLPAIGHVWGEPVYVWAEDDAAVTASVACVNDASHVITETVEPYFVLTQYSTYKTEGKGVYTATFKNELFTEQTKEITIPAVACDGGDTCPGKHFTDEPTVDSWAHIPIDWAVVNKITFGTSPTTFSPDNPCTRAQFVTFLWRTMGQPEPTITENPFKDVAEDTYYYKAVLWAYENKITDGTSATTFDPDLNCTRAQIVTLLWRMEGRQEPASAETAFKDIRSSAYYYTAVLWAVEKGITEGTSETTFTPNDFCTRAQCLAFLYREFAK